MKIELQDRQYWIEAANAQLKKIQEIRKEKDAAYEKAWRKRKWPFKDRPETEFPPKDKDIFHICDYPSEFGRYNKFLIKNLLLALRTDKTGVIMVDDNELQALQAL